MDINLEEFIIYYKDHSDKFVKEKYKLGRRGLINFLNNNNIQKHTKAENIVLTNNQLYECSNVMSSAEVKKHFRDIYGDSGSPFCKKEIRDRRDNTIREKYGVENVFQVPEIKNKIKNIQVERYGAIGFESSYQKNKWNKYLYNGISFDSSWELALWIYANDHHEEIVREPIYFEYSCSEGVFRYYPDFIYNGELVEVKGNHLISSDSVIDPRLKWSEDRCKSKYKCMLDNGVKILLRKDILFALDYVKEKFNDKFWYRRFMNRRGSN